MRLEWDKRNVEGSIASVREEKLEFARDAVSFDRRDCVPVGKYSIHCTISYVFDGVREICRGLADVAENSDALTLRFELTNSLSVLLTPTCAAWVRTRIAEYRYENENAETHVARARDLAKSGYIPPRVRAQLAAQESA